MAKELETRKCVISGEVLNKENLLRFVTLKDGTMLPDFNKKIDGRGFYISNSKKLLQSLVEKHPFNKILHKKVEYALKNMFPSVNKMTFGRISSFCPVFSFCDHRTFRSQRT